jgi:hypothetical protein
VKSLAWLAALFCLAGLVVACSRDAKPEREGFPMITGSFRLAEDELVLGGPIYVLFDYDNSSRDRALRFAIGNGRADSYRFIPEDEARVELLDPYFELGGLAAETEVPPGGSGSQRILLNRYLKFREAGSHRIAGELDLDVEETVTGVHHPVSVRGVLEVRLRDDPAALEHLLADLERQIEADPASQLSAISLLAELRLASGLPLLASGLNARDGAVVEAAITGLGNLGGPEARDLLEAFIDASDSELQIKLARQALQRAR